MKQTIRKLFFLALLLCAGQTIYAYDFEVDSIYIISFPIVPLR